MAIDKNSAGGYSMPTKKAILSARSCQMEATRITPLTPNHRTECSIFKLRLRIKFRTKIKSARLKNMMVILALSGMARIHQFLVTEENGVDRQQHLDDVVDGLKTAMHGFTGLTAIHYHGDLGDLVASVV